MTSLILRNQPSAGCLDYCSISTGLESRLFPIQALLLHQILRCLEIASFSQQINRIHNINNEHNNQIQLFNRPG